MRADEPVCRIEEVTALSDDVIEALNRLIPQFSSSTSRVPRETVAAIVASPVTRLLVARDASSGIVGTLSLVVFRIPTGTHAFIEDVIVDRAVRGRGVGEALARAAVALAAEAGARTVDLTSRPTREAANRLYEKIGFERRDTNVYRLVIEQSA